MIILFAQLKYAWLDIKNSKRISIIFLLQMIVVFLLFNYSFVDIIRVNNGLNRLEGLKEKKAYINRDATSNVKIDALIADEKNSIVKMKELYKYITFSNSSQKYSRWQYTVPESVNGHSIVQASASKTFFEIYNIKVIEGRMFNEEDYTKNAEYIPIIVGYNLKDRYKVGKIYTEKDQGNKNVTYKVIGTLENNSSYPSLTDIGREIDLNYTYFRPASVDLLNDFASLDMAINSTVIFTNNESDLRLIEKKSNDLGLFSMQYKIINDRIDDFINYFEKKILYQMFLAVIILLFAATSMALNLTTLISKKMKEFSIHIICGGGISSIIQRLLWQLMMILSVALIPALLSNGINESLIYTVTLAGFILVLIMIAPYIKIKTFSIAQLVRRNE